MTQDAYALQPEREEYIHTLEARNKYLEDELEACKATLRNNCGSMNFLNGVLDQSLVGIYAIDGDTFSYVNKQFATIFGYDSQSEIIGKVKITELVAPEYRELVVENVRKRSAFECAEIRYTFTGLRKDGSRNLVEVHGRAMEIESRHLVIGVILDMTHYERMTDLAYHDSLTGLPNRALFMDRLEQTVAQARRSNEEFSLLFIDLDEFKQVNDTVGHAAGDLVLQKSAQRMLELVPRESDTVSRLGGDEFVILLNGSGKRDFCAELAGRLIRRLGQPVCFGERIVTVGASIGIGIFPADGNDSKSILKAADSAMYEAKRRGKRTYAFAGSPECP